MFLIVPIAEGSEVDLELHHGPRFQGSLVIDGIWIKRAS